MTVENKELFWVKVKDVQDRLGVKNIRDLLRRLKKKKRLNKKENKKYILGLNME